MKIDEIDIKILRELERNARTTYSSIARKCDVSVDTIIKRYKKLHQEGIIKKSTVLLDPRALGSQCIANFDIDVTPQEIDQLINDLKMTEGILFCTANMGRFDVFAIALKENMVEMNLLKEEIQSLDPVKDVRTSIWVDQFLLCPENFELSIDMVN